MGESAVLFHSYSFAAPSSRNESHEDNPIHALGQSVSFGRFMTENLEWGRWSSFSHKKYVDEAEKFSQPGSVAQKKAFFEAHYKRIAEAKKAKASNELSSSSSSSADDENPKQQPESVVVLLNTLETLTKDEVKEEEEVDETDLVLTSSDEELVLSIEKDEETERKSVVVLEQEDDLLVDPMIADDLQAAHEVPYQMDEKESYTEDAKLLKKSCSVETRSVSQNSSVKVPARHRFSLLSCLIGNTKTTDQDQNLTRKKRKTDKKPNKPFLFLCFKPEMVGATEAPTRTQSRRNL